MVEGHSVHRVASLHRKRLVGKSFQATSPNGRFVEGAAAIDGKRFSRIEAVGKNLFAFFGDDANANNNVVVVHVHFGMAGAWAVYYNDEEEVPEPSTTNRLRLVYEDDNEKITADLSAMTVAMGGIELYVSKRAKLGQDPLRSDADPEVLWTKVSASKKSIGALIMDQSCFAGPGNIYRAEILFLSGVHPDIPGNELNRSDFDLIWKHTVALLRRGYECGSILTVDRQEAIRLGQPKLRRYIYNASKCPRCKTSILTWSIQNRTCYACPKCQPWSPRRRMSTDASPEKDTDTNGKTFCIPFHSHCARESLMTRLADGGPNRLTVKEIKSCLYALGVDKKETVRLKKAALIEVLMCKQAQRDVAAPVIRDSPSSFHGKQSKHNDAPAMRGAAAAVITPERPNSDMVTPEDAAREKALADESLAVEHIAELGPGQARRARASTMKRKRLGFTTNDDDGSDRKVAAASKTRRKR